MLHFTAVCPICDRCTTHLHRLQTLALLDSDCRVVLLNWHRCLYLCLDAFRLACMAGHNRSCSAQHVAAHRWCALLTGPQFGGVIACIMRRCFMWRFWKCEAISCTICISRRVMFNNTCSCWLNAIARYYFDRDQHFKVFYFVTGPMDM